MTFAPFSITGIGSMPHREPSDACKLILEHFDIPFWPQLPKLSVRESMIVQFSEGFPGFTLDADKAFVKKNEEEIYTWLSNYTEETLEPVSEKYSSGLYSLAEALENKKIPVIKGQITGPLTFTLSLKDEEGRLIYFDETLREISLLHLKAKVKWQINFLKKVADEIIIFVDEPILQAVGTSAYISVEQTEAMRLVRELVHFIKSNGAKAGIHCCGRADWKEVMASGIDILSFDAFFFFDFLKIYKEEIEEFLNKGGFIAWGFIPTTDDIYSLSDDQIIKSALSKISEISKQIPLIKTNSLITPSCGMGSLELSAAQRVCHLLRLLKKLLNE